MVNPLGYEQKDTRDKAIVDLCMRRDSIMYVLFNASRENMSVNKSFWPQYNN